MVEVLPVDTLDEVMEFALIKHAEKAGLVERLGLVIDRFAPVANNTTSA